MESRKTCFGKAACRWHYAGAVALCGLFLSLGGCWNLEPRVDPTRFYVLETGTAETEKGPFSEAANRSMEVRLVQFPEYAQRTGLAVREGPHEIRYLPWHRWGEPPESSFIGAAVAALAGELPQWTIRRHANAGAAVLELEVLRWDAFARGEAVLEARWRYRGDGRTGEARAGTVPWHRGRWATGWDPARPADLVAAHSENIRQWAAAVAAGLRDR